MKCIRKEIRLYCLFSIDDSSCISWEFVKTFALIKDSSRRLIFFFQALHVVDDTTLLPNDYTRTRKCVKNREGGQESERERSEQQREIEVKAEREKRKRVENYCVLVDYNMYYDGGIVYRTKNDLRSCSFVTLLLHSILFICRR